MNTLDAVMLAPALVGGAAVGSFLGVVAARVPPLLQENERGFVSPRRLVSALSFPSSRCDHCREAIAWHDNIPMVSWLVLRGHCRACGHFFGVGGLLLELGGAAAALLSAALLGWSAEGALAFLLMAVLLALSAIDLREMLLPDILVAPLLPAGLIFQAFYGDGVLSGLMGAAAAFAVMWAIGAGYVLARKTEGLGGGDIKLAGALGAWLGILKIPFFLLCAFTSGVLVMGVVMMISRRGGQAPLPFGPFLAASAALFVVMPQAQTLLAQLIAG